MQFEDKISVIVTTYNQEHTIGRTLDSIIKQRCHLPIEIVVGEDCSTDNTRSVCEYYAERYPDVVRLMPKTPNKGLVDNYFDCLLACRGKYIADCAGDDYWTDPEKLEKECRMMDANPDMTIVHTNWLNYHEDTRQKDVNGIVLFPKPVTDGRQMLEAIVTQTAAPVIHLCTALYRAETIRRCYEADVELFRNRENGCEDLQIAFMLALNGKVGYIPDATIVYSIGKPSVSFSTDSHKQFLFVRRTASLSWTLAQRYGIDTDSTRRFFALKVFELMMHAFRSGDRVLADGADECMKAWNIRMDKRIKVVRFIMSNNLLWHTAIVARRLFVGFKRLAHR